MAAVRYLWMFRTAAVVYLMFGLSGIWRFGLTGYDPPHRLLGVALGALAAIVGVFLFRRAKFAIALSAFGAVIIAIAAAFAAPVMRGPVILAFGLLALLCALYAALAARELFARHSGDPPVR
jgi:peptidoglycan/LPS O-acetylase OafA/YrhL